MLLGVDPRIDAATVFAVMQWEYKPTLLDGVPVPVIIDLPFNYRMK